jgi:hypothetical protein
MLDFSESKLLSLVELVIRKTTAHYDARRSNSFLSFFLVRTCNRPTVSVDVHTGGGEGQREGSDQSGRLSIKERWGLKSESLRTS